VVSNIVEYLVHRHIMHKEIPGLRAMYERHTRRHHRYFTIDDPELSGQNDLHAVLFPPVLLLFFSTIAVLFSSIVGLALGRPAGVLFFLAALTYYLAYEALHLLSHWPLKGAPGKSAMIRRIVSHHRLHHAPELMRRGNFNIFLPLADWLFRTLRRETPLASSDLNQSNPAAKIVSLD
jgi:Fatty acid hydroxylase superfamily